MCERQYFVCEGWREESEKNEKDEGDKIPNGLKYIAQKINLTTSNLKLTILRTSHTT